MVSGFSGIVSPPDSGEIMGYLPTKHPSEKTAFVPIYVSLWSSAADVNSTNASAAMRPVPRGAYRLTFSVESFNFTDYIMHEELLCVGSSSSGAVSHKHVGVDIAFFAYSIWLITASILGHEASISRRTACRLFAQLTRHT